MRRSTSGQIQVGESLAVIVVFIILVFFGLAWFASTSTVSSQLAVDQATRLNLLEKTKELMNLQELGCSINGRSEKTCIDIYRARALERLLERDQSVRDRYAEQFAGYTVHLDFLYPAIPGVQNMTIMDFAPEKNRSAASHIPIIAYDPSTDTRHLSMLVLTQWRSR